MQIKYKLGLHLKLTGYYLELLMPVTLEIFRSTKSKITKTENGENIPHLDITEAVLVHCSIVNNGYQLDSRVLYALFLINCLVNC